LLAGTAGGLWFWPSSETRAAYPFAHRVAGTSNPLWLVAPERLLAATNDDAARLLRFVPALEAAVARLEGLEPRVASARVGELTGEDRERLREQWWQVLDPMLALDEIKSRYAGWYGIDYFHQARLHARGFALSFSALCAQVNAGLRLLGVLEGKPLLATLFNEAMPQFGVPARTLSALRTQLGRARDLLLIPLGNDWYDRWIAVHLALDPSFTPLVTLLDPLREATRARVLTPTAQGMTNAVDVLKSVMFQRWFPLQKNFAEWAGDTRLAKQERPDQRRAAGRIQDQAPARRHHLGAPQLVRVQHRPPRLLAACRAVRGQPSANLGRFAGPTRDQRGLRRSERGLQQEVSQSLGEPRGAGPRGARAVRDRSGE
jgi:hypothetical protein